MIAENLLREPDNPKFRQFKPTNTIIKRDLVNPKGALEYAVAVRRTPFFCCAVTPFSSRDTSFPHPFLFLADGFPSRGLFAFSSPPLMCHVADCDTYPRPSQVIHYQPYYTFSNKHMTELHIGAAILREAIQTAEKEDDERLRLKMAKAEEEMRIKRVCSLRHKIPSYWIQLCSRQRKPLWMIARRRCSVPNVNDSSVTRRSTTGPSHLHLPVRRKKTWKSKARCSCSIHVNVREPIKMQVNPSPSDQSIHCRSLCITSITISKMLLQCL